MLLTSLVYSIRTSAVPVMPPDPKSGPQESAVRIKVVRPRHRMETIDRDSILAIEAVIGSRPAHLTQDLAWGSTPFDWPRFSAASEVFDDFFIFLTDIPIIFISEDAESALL